MTTPQHKNPCPGGHEINNFGKLPWPSLSDLCLSEGKKILAEIMQFPYMTYMAMPKQRTPAQGVMKFTILVDPSMVIITIYRIPLNIIHTFFLEFFL